MIGIDSFELVTVENDFITCDKLVWNFYRNRAPGVLEALLAHNPHLAKIHKWTPFIPAGIIVRMPINQALLSGSPQKQEKIIWWERSEHPSGPSR